MCDCRLVSVYVRSHTYSQCVCLYVYMYVCVCECIRIAMCPTSQAASLYRLCLVFCCCLWMPPLDPALPLLAPPFPPPLLTHAHPLPLPHNIIIYASKMT